MSYIQRQKSADKTDGCNSRNSSSALFGDQRASAAVQLKQQQIMHAAHSPNVIQQMTAEKERIQGEFKSDASAQLQKAPAAKLNNTGLPDNLKSGIENLSGYSMDDVKVHYNSDKPAQLNAHAYAQGTDIHVAPGQEQHLPHEAWHVVQQKQGRVQATMQMKAGMPVNDDAGLENEADVMGAKAMVQRAGIDGKGCGENIASSPSLRGGQVQMKKDPAVAVFNDGEPGVTTATKVIDPKDGSRGLFKYRYGAGNIIDTFNGTNIAKPEIAKDTVYEGLAAPNIAVPVPQHDLSADCGSGALSIKQITNGGRPLHFNHADSAHKVDRSNKYTWHHLQKVGKMELIDMNVHGAMWHYGGIAGWDASLHTSDSSDDDPS